MVRCTRRPICFTLSFTNSTLALRGWTHKMLAWRFLTVQEAGGGGHAGVRLLNPLGGDVIAADSLHLVLKDLCDVHTGGGAASHLLATGAALNILNMAQVCKVVLREFTATYRRSSSSSLLRLVPVLQNWCVSGRRSLTTLIYP